MLSARRITRHDQRSGVWEILIALIAYNRFTVINTVCISSLIPI